MAPLAAAASTLASLHLLLVLRLPPPAHAQDAARREGDLGAACLPSGRCHVLHARCVEAVCTCPRSMVAAARGRRCLPVSGELGAPCEEDAQCAGMAHAVCRRRTRVCACRKGLVQAEGLCLAEAALGEKCQHAEQCTGLTECSVERGTCVCRGIAFEAGGRCVTDDENAGGDWGAPGDAPPEPADEEDEENGAGSGATSLKLFGGLFTILALGLASQRVR